MRAGETLIDADATSQVSISEAVFVSVLPSGASVTIPLPSTEWYFSGTALKLKRPLAYNATVYWGASATEPNFTIPNGCRGLTVQNRATTVIYIRNGLSNSSGIPIGKPGDSNTTDVQGIAIAAGGSFCLNASEVSAGDKWWVLGASGSESVIVNFT